ncbi:MAG: hypothetical protein M1821_003930 [Bathelium mastoideum]|nr:MAG: hypothetical protein M1821_003930 [Bathelium mastoideum]
MSTKEPDRPNERPQLLRGLKFWVSFRCPTRSSFVQSIEYLGGEIVPLESQADKLIVDHLRKDNPPGSISYQWIEHSYKKGELQPLEDYLQGPSHGAKRGIGSTRSSKSSRTPFTLEDDRVVWNFVQQCVKAGERALGNEIYKEFGQEHPRHPWQSWRDRYVKYLQHKPPHGCQSTPTTPSSSFPGKSKVKLNKQPSGRVERQPTPQVEEATCTSWSEQYGEFTQEDFDELLAQASDISDIPMGTYLTKTWRALEAKSPEHTAERWRHFYENVVFPAYQKSLEEELKDQSPPTAQAEMVPAKARQEDYTDQPQQSKVNTHVSIVSVPDDSSTDREPRSASEPQVADEQVTPFETTQPQVEINQELDAASKTYLTAFGQENDIPLRKRRLMDEAHETVPDEVGASPTHKRKRPDNSPSLHGASATLETPLAMPASSPSRFNPININLSSDEEEDDVTGPSAIGNELPDVEEQAHLAPDDEQPFWAEETQQKDREHHDNSDSSSSFDPITSSAAARAMIGKRVKSRSNSTQNTPQSSSRKRRRGPDQRTFDRLIDNDEADMDGSEQFSTPRRRRRVQQGRTSPSTSPLTTRSSRIQAESSATRRRLESPSTRSVSPYIAHDISEQRDKRNVVEEISYPQIRNSSRPSQMHQGMLPTARMGPQSDVSIFAEASLTTNGDGNGVSNDQVDSSLEEDVEIAHDVEDITGTVLDDVTPTPQNASNQAEAEELSDAETDTFFDAQTRQLDLDLVEPSGGFDTLLEDPVDNNGIDGYDNEDQAPAIVRSPRKLKDGQRDMTLDNPKSNSTRTKDRTDILLERNANRVDSTLYPSMDVKSSSRNEESPASDDNEFSNPWIRQKTVDTQNFLDFDAAELPDLHIPSPDKSLGLSAHPSSPSVAPSSHKDEGPQNLHDSQTEMSYLNSYLTEMVEAGHDYNHVVEALHATCLDAELAREILPKLGSGQGIPKNIRGVWTADDDEQVEGGDGKYIKRLESKHGWALVQERLKFLQDWRDGQAQNSQAE